MILFITNDTDASSLDLMEWITHLGGHFRVLKGDDVLGGAPFSYTLTSGQEAHIRLPDHDLLTQEKFRAVFYRRWKSSPYNQSISFEWVTDPELRMKMEHHLREEQQYNDAGLLALLENAYWLGSYGIKASDDKIKVLEYARQVGLFIPATLVTSQKSQLDRFYKQQAPLITKCIHNVTLLSHESDRYMMYTQEVTREDIDQLPDHFFPSLFQKQILKELELRIFYLESVCYPMAIFSQKNEQTSVDFRRYDRAKENRRVPFTLPTHISDALDKLMKKLELNTGSIDMILTSDGEYVFLEVNPLGQFGMTSYPCNYELEKKIAEHLIKKDQKAAVKDQKYKPQHI